MGRLRKPISFAKDEGGKRVAYFGHPLRNKKTVRVVLGTGDDAEYNLKLLNSVFMDEKKWRKLPAGLPECVRNAWGNPAAVKVNAESGVRRGENKLSTADVARDVAALAAYQKLVEDLRAEVEALQKEVAHWKGKKINRNATATTLREAFDKWFKNFSGTGDKKDTDHLNAVKWDVLRFIKKFGESTTLAEIEGREKEIDLWISGLTTAEPIERTYTQRKERRRDRKNKSPEMEQVKAVYVPQTKPKQLSAGRRRHIRLYVLKFLRENGIDLDAAKFAKIAKDESVIRWLEKAEAERLKQHLPEYWRDVFRVQASIGLRPDELPTLKKADFSSDYSRLTLSEAEHLTLKLGTREIFIPEAIREIFRKRLTDSAIVFPNPNTGALWQSAKRFDRLYLKALRKAGAAANITTPIDCRIGRRTCASILLRSGQSTEKVGALLGDNPTTIRKHYAKILPHEVDSSAAAI